MLKQFRGYVRQTGPHNLPSRFTQAWWAPLIRYGDRVAWLSISAGVSAPYM